MKTNFSIFGKIQKEVVEIVRSGMTAEGFIIVTENDLNDRNSEKEKLYRFVIDCNSLLASELEKKGLVPNFPYLNLTIRTSNKLKSEIKINDPNLMMTDFQLKRFRPMIPLLEEYLIQALDGVMEY